MASWHHGIIIPNTIYFEIFDVSRSRREGGHGSNSEAPMAAPMSAPMAAPMASMAAPMASPYIGAQSGGDFGLGAPAPAPVCGRVAEMILRP